MTWMISMVNRFGMVICVDFVMTTMTILQLVQIVVPIAVQIVHTAPLALTAMVSTLHRPIPLPHRMLPTVSGARRWRKVAGPIAATIAVLHDIFWKPCDATFWVQPEGPDRPTRGHHPLDVETWGVDHSGA